MRLTYRKTMKKVIKISLIFILVPIYSGCGCGSRIERAAVSDGYFKYYYEKHEDAYSIVGTEEAGFAETMIIPAYFRGKVVKHLGHTVYSAYGGTSSESRYIDLNGAKTVYFPFGVEVWANKDWVNFICNTDCAVPSYSSAGIAYVTNIVFNNSIEIINSQNDKWGTDNPRYFYELKDNRTLEWRYRTDKVSTTMIIANTVYKFNYEGEPNEGYFFINEFETGGKIENTPYEPQREGYEFTGWYKEPECKNKWDFEKDTLPAAEYEEDGTIKFKETALYAGWNKK